MALRVEDLERTIGELDRDPRARARGDAGSRAGRRESSLGFEGEAARPRAGQALKDRVCWFLFLPPYSPDLNPIEMAFAKLKAHLRKHAERSVATLWQRIGALVPAFTSTECRNFLLNSGYA